MPTDYDLIVIGSGGGQKIAMPAAAMGRRVALIESGPLGGTCLNRGCIPSKMLIYPGEVADTIRDAERFGITLPGGIGPIDFPGIIQRIATTVDAIAASQRTFCLQHPKITLLEGHARFVADHTIEVGGMRLTAPLIFIATGAQPDVPELPGLAGTPYLTSTEALRHATLPKRLLVLGAGYIAAELGYAYRALGSEVHFFVRSRFFRKEADDDIATEFERVFRHRHTIHPKTSINAVRHAAGVFTLTAETDGHIREVTGDALLIATGIRPATDDLGLEHTAIRRDARGCIVVNPHLETTVPGVYALGDCAGNHFFRHTVNHEGEYLVRHVLRRETDAPLDYGPVPHAIFTEPQIAGVGLSERAAQAAGIDVVIGKATYADSTPGMARLADHGFVKVLVERATGLLLGAHIIGPEASDMIHLFIVAIKLKARLEDLLDTIYIHPALPEVARDALRDARANRAGRIGD